LYSDVAVVRRHTRTKCVGTDRYIGDSLHW